MSSGIREAAKSIVIYRDSILADIEHGLSNGRIESVSTKIRLITRVAVGFQSAHALIALAMLSSAATDPPQAENDPHISQESSTSPRHS